MQAKPKTLEAFEYLKTYSGLTDSNNLTYRRWLNDGQNLVKKSPADGYLLQGFAYHLLGDISLAITSMQKARRLNDYFGKINYATLVFRSGDYQQSIQVCLDLLAQNKEDQYVRSLLLECADFALDADLVKKLLQSDKGNEVLQSLALSIDKEIQVLSDIGIDKMAYIAVKQAVFELLSNYYVGDCVIKPCVIDNEMGKQVQLSVYLDNVGIDDCLRLDNALLDKLIDDELPFDQYKNVVVHFIPAKYAKVA